MPTVITALIIFTIFLFLLLIYFGIHKSKPRVFIPPQKQSVTTRIHSARSPVHIYFALCDCFKPFSGSVSQEIAEHRIVTWCKEYTQLAKSHNDSIGKVPAHSFFYSEADYNPQLLDILYRLYKADMADVEIMLSEGSESDDEFRRKLEKFRDVLFHHHGFLRKGASEKICYGFSYGLDSVNNNETKGSSNFNYDRNQILIDTGCFADFTCFLKKKNKPLAMHLSSDIFSEKSTIDSLPQLVPRAWTIKNLLTIQDPNFLKWNTGTFGIFPYLENGEISAFKKFYPFRLKLWLQNCIRIETDSKHIFIKLHTFGGIDHNIRYLLGENGLHLMWSYIEKFCLRNNFVLHYVSAWEMYTSITSIFLQNNLNKPTATTTL